MVSVIVRSGRDLLEISSGLLIEGCPDDVNRSVIGNPLCKQKCGLHHETPHPAWYGEMCLYDCLIAEESAADVKVRDRR